MEFADSYRDFFNVARRNVADKARCYLAGLLMKAPRKNMERMEEYVAEFNYQAQQQFLSDSPWDYRALNEQVSRDVDALLGGADAALVINESAFAKQGVKSVGVARQWNGRLGKVDNSQVGVFAVLTNGGRSSLVDERLYLPAKWIDDPERCVGAGIPDECRVFKKKSELALEMVDAACRNGMSFGWVLSDAGYGKEPQYLRDLDDRNLVFISDVHRDQRIYAENPRIHLPVRTSAKGRAPTRHPAKGNSIAIDKYFNSVADDQWQNHVLQDTTRGKIKVKACAKRLWLWDKKEKEAREWWAVCVKYADTGDTKWFLSNAPENTEPRTLLLQHAKRFWVERTFEDAKGSVGMADYQARGWLAWHHHMAMVSLGMLFMLRERMVHNLDIELLSCNDIVELLHIYLPRADLTPAAVVRNIERRHRKRWAAIESARRREKPRENEEKSDHAVF
jgi:SRSO17 transposase